MTRTLTIIALLFATPVVAEDCNYTPREHFSIIQTYSCFSVLNDDPNQRRKCEERREKEAAELKAKLDAKARAVGLENGEEFAAAQYNCYTLMNKSGCEKERKRLRCNEIIKPIKGYVQPSANSYDDLEMRIMTLEAEVEQLRNR
jgi:hypothetical protein